MSRFECPACHSMIDSEVSECPICGLLNPRITGDVYNKQEIIERLSHQHRQDLLAGLEIGVRALAHKAEGDHYVSDGTRYVSLFKGEDLVYGETYWSDYAFGQSARDDQAQLHLILQKNQQPHEFRLKYKTPELDDLWYVGITLQAGFKCVIRIGNPEKYTETEAFSLI